MNAYLHEPVLGPDGLFHLSWVLCNTPDCKTNHDLSYAVSADLIQGAPRRGRPSNCP